LKAYLEAPFAKKNLEGLSIREEIKRWAIPPRRTLVKKSRKYMSKNIRCNIWFFG
jgi:hypothetical protein